MSMKELHAAADRLTETFAEAQKRHPMPIDQLAVQVYGWAQMTFPDRTMGGMAIKLYEEIGEWLRNPRNGLEFADVMIMLLDAAVQMDIDIQHCVLDKLAINKRRVWRVDHELGIMRHED